MLFVLCDQMFKHKRNEDARPVSPVRCRFNQVKKVTV